MLRCLKIILLMCVVVERVRGYSLYSGIFDPNPFIPKISPEVLKITSSALYDPIYGYGFSGDTKNDETGYVKSNSEKEAGGFHHVETFQKKDGDDYEHEYESGRGESKNNEDNDDRQAPSIQKRESDGVGDAGHGNYEVVEEHGNDHKNPNHHTTYGVKPKKPSKKPLIPEFGTRLTLPKKTTLTKNHNGYETVVYHGQENESSEKGYDWRNHHRAPPKPVIVHQKVDEEEDEELEVNEKDNQDDDYEKDSDESNFGDNYNGFKFDSNFKDFSKNFNDDDEQDRSEERESGKGTTRDSSRNNYDYDEEVDREEVDEAANEDRYQGGEYDDGHYGKDDRRQHEYASEADYDDAQ